jgi:hypothetical protein
VLLGVGRTTGQSSTGEKGMLSYSTNQVVHIFSKEAGENTDLWGVIIGGKRGYMDNGDVEVDRVYRKELQYIVPTELGMIRERQGRQDLGLDPQHQASRDILVGGFRSVNDLMDDLDNILNHKGNNVDDVIFNENSNAATKLVEKPVTPTASPLRPSPLFEAGTINREASTSNEEDQGAHRVAFHPTKLSAMPKDQVVNTSKQDVSKKVESPDIISPHKQEKLKQDVRPREQETTPVKQDSTTTFVQDNSKPPKAPSMQYRKPNSKSHQEVASSNHNYNVSKKDAITPKKDAIPPRNDVMPPKNDSISSKQDAIPLSKMLSQPCRFQAHPRKIVTLPIRMLTD